MKPTESIVASVQHTTAVLFSPYEPGIATETLKPRNAVLWQLGGGALCVALLSARASWFEASNHKFSGSGTGLLVGLVLAGQLLAYFAYIFLAAAAAYLFVKRATSYRGTLGVVSYSTFPLLLGWAFQTIVAFTRPSASVGGIEDVHAFLQTIWAALAVRTDFAVWWSSAPGPLGLVLRSLGLFWLWHGVNLWAGLRNAQRCSRSVAAAILLLLTAVVVVGNGFAEAVGAHWDEAVVWSE